MNKKQLNELLERGRQELSALFTAAETATDQVAALNDIKAKQAELASAQGQLDAIVERESLAKQHALAATRQPAQVHDRAEDRPFGSLGEQLSAIALAAVPASRGGMLDPRLRHQELAPSGASATVQADGGYLIRSEFSTQLLTRAREASQLFSRTTEIPISEGNDGVELPYVNETSRANGSRFGGVQVYRAAEADTVTATKPQLGKLDIRLESLKGLMYATERLLRNGAAIQAIAENAFSSEFSFKIDDEIFRGNGAGQCLGFTVAPNLMVTVAKESSQSAAGIVVANLTKMMTRMPARSFQRAVWLCNQDCLGEFPLMTIGNMPVYLPGGNIAGAPFGTIFGRPIVPIEQAETMGTKNDLVLADLTQYLTITQGGIRGAQSMHVRFIYDEMTFKWGWDVNGQPAWKQALTPYKGSNTLSPFVNLATRP